mgnify:CR=1 FL=1
MNFPLLMKKKLKRKELLDALNIYVVASAPFYRSLFSVTCKYNFIRFCRGNVI